MTNPERAIEIADAAMEFTKHGEPIAYDGSLAIETEHVTERVCACGDLITDGNHTQCNVCEYVFSAHKSHVGNQHE